VAPLADRVLVLASLIVLFPGLALTIAMVELATGNLASGTARLGGAVTRLLLLAFGVALGRTLAHTMFALPTHVDLEDASAIARVVALVIFELGLVVLFQTRRRELGWILLGAIVGASVGYMGTQAWGPELGSVLGAGALTLLANAFSRLQDRP